MGAAAVAALPGTTFASAALVVAAPHLVQASSTPSSPGLLLPGSPPSGPPFPASYPLLGRVIADRVTPGPAFSSRSLPPLPKPGLPARPRSPSMRATSTSPTVGATDALPSRSCRPPGRRPTCGISHACCLSYRGHSPCWGGGVGVRGCGGGVDGVRVGRGGVGSGASAGVIRGGVGGGDWVAVIRGGIGGGGCRGGGVNGNGGCGGGGRVGGGVNGNGGCGVGGSCLASGCVGSGAGAHSASSSSCSRAKRSCHAASASATFRASTICWKRRRVATRASINRLISTGSSVGGATPRLIRP
ncbi:loricrin-like [Drosophila simulans]|uniref:loricrin-like n=1 Tax=Drosophila simulans TaxID=7240 RepID=UPI00192CE66A|nr:loricrin-like [Drosophila simulans]